MLTADEYNRIQQQLAQEGWQRTQFDGGQSHLMGWTIMAVWEKDKAKITLHHNERYNEVSYEVEASPLGLAWLKQAGYAHVFG